MKNAEKRDNERQKLFLPKGSIMKD